MLTDEEIEGFGQKFQGKARENIVTMPAEIHYVIQSLIGEICELKEKNKILQQKLDSHN